MTEIVRESKIKEALKLTQDGYKNYGIAVIYRGIEGETLKLDFILAKKNIYESNPHLVEAIESNFRRRSELGISEVRILNVGNEWEHKDFRRDSVEESPLFKSLGV